MSLFRPLKYITDVTESKSIQIMKIAQFIYNYYIKRDETSDICIVKLPSRAANNGRSTDKVWPDRGLDRSNSGLAGHFWIQTLYFPYSCRLMLYNAAMISFFFGVFCCFALNPSKKKNAAIN